MWERYLIFFPYRFYLFYSLLLELHFSFKCYRIANTFGREKFPPGSLLMIGLLHLKIQMDGEASAVGGYVTKLLSKYDLSLLAIQKSIEKNTVYLISSSKKKKIINSDSFFRSIFLSKFVFKSVTLLFIRLY